MNKGKSMFNPAFNAQRFQRSSIVCMNQKMVEDMIDLLESDYERRKAAGEEINEAFTRLSDKLTEDVEHWNKYDRQKAA